jgi:hypothetical protein
MVGQSGITGGDPAAAQRVRPPLTTTTAGAGVPGGSGPACTTATPRRCRRRRRAGGPPRIQLGPYRAVAGPTRATGCAQQRRERQPEPWRRHSGGQRERPPCMGQHVAKQPARRDRTAPCESARERPWFPVNGASLRASRTVVAPVIVAPVTTSAVRGRPATAASQSATLHPDMVTAGSVPGLPGLILRVIPIASHDRAINRSRAPHRRSALRRRSALHRLVGGWCSGRP